MHEILNSKIKIGRVYNHMVNWPCAEIIMCFPKYVKGSHGFTTNFCNNGQVWLLRKLVRLKQCDFEPRLKDESSYVLNSTANRIIDVVNEKVKSVHDKYENVDKFYVCTNNMGPFLTINDEMYLANGSKKMLQNSLTIIGKSLYESEKTQLVPSENSKKYLNKIGRRH